jgi:glycosyltransferase involved in cell wall biosynthesis
LVTGGVPVVATVLDLSFRWFPGAYRLAFRAFYRMMTGLVMYKATRVVSISEGERTRISEVYARNRQKLRVVRLGVAEEFFSIQPNGLSGRPNILYVGSTNPRKNIVGLLQAFQVVLEKIPHTLRIVGTAGPQFRCDPAVARLVHAIPPDRLEVVGYISDESRLRELYGEASLFAFPSFYEAFGLPVLEAMAAGVPVVASDIPALREVGGDCILYCQPQDPRSIAEAILDGVSGGASLVDHAKKRAREFTWDKCAASLEAVFDEVLQTA